MGVLLIEVLSLKLIALLSQLFDFFWTQQAKKGYHFVIDIVDLENNRHQQQEARYKHEDRKR